MTAANPMHDQRPHVKFCGAKTRGGTPCKNAAMPNGRCRMHGGKSLGGLAAPDQRAGLRYSKYLPARLAGRFQESLNDGKLLELTAEIALTDSRLEDLLKRVDTGESGRLWSELKRHYGQMQGTRDPDKRQEHLSAIFSIIARQGDDYDAWDEIHRLIEHRRRLVESERKRHVELQQYITAQQAMTLIAAVMAAIKEHVSDRHTLQAISATVNQLVSANAD